MAVGSFQKKTLISAGLLALIPALIVFLFLPRMGLKYKLEIEPVDETQVQNVFEDLDSDSITEVLSSGIGLPYYHILVQDNDFRIHDQWNFQDSLDKEMCDFFFGNYDNDRYKEIYCFTYKDDSLFLNINEFFDPVGTRLDRLYITKIRVVNKIITSMIYPAGFFDLTGDGKCELYFSIQTGFGVEPRRLYCYDIVKNELRTSEFTGVMCSAPKMLDSDGDNKPEIFGLMSASANYKTWVPFTDKSTWLMIFDEKLKFEFPPVEFPGFTNILEIEAYKNNDFSGYMATHNTGSADITVLKPRIMIFDLNGKMMRERLYSDLGLRFHSRLVVLKYMNVDRIYILGNKLIELNNELDVINNTDSPFSSYFNCYKEDINFDGKPELVLFSASEEKMVIYNASLQKLAEAKLKATNYIQKFSHYHSISREQKVFMQAGKYGYFLKLVRNSKYYLGLSAYPGIFLLFFFFILLIIQISTRQVEKRESLKRRLITLQLQGIKSQLDPHFTFNTLNAVASLIYLEDRQAAYDYMNKFTQLLRGMLNDAERIYRSLGEELEFVTTYLELEKLRFGDKFNFIIETRDDVSHNIQVPKLVLQTFAENSIKHGLMPCSDGGILKIAAEMEKDYLKLTIEDNGIGRKKAAGKSTSTGKGLKITGEFYDILNQINRKPIKHLITDLYNETGNSSGTRVEVWVPVE